MKWPLLVAAGLAFIWALASGIYSIRDITADGGESEAVAEDVPAWLSTSATLTSRNVERKAL